MLRRQITARQRVSARAGDRCEYCKYPASLTSGAFQVDHIIPISSGGADDLSNVCWACGSCNNHKNTAITNTDPQTSDIVPLFNPRRDLWSDHFAWDTADDTRMIGRTAIGRATVERLRLNHDGVVNLRGVLKLLGRHP